MTRREHPSEVNVPQLKVDARNIPPAASGISERDLLRRFISLGDNCEFGFVQRAYSAEPLDLLRWAATPIEVLIDLLENRFAGIGDPASLRIRETDAGEYMVDHTLYGFSWHAFASVGRITSGMLTLRESRRLRRMAEMLIEHLEAGERIPVIKREGGMSLQDAARVFERIRAYGPAPLLYVTLADADHAAGTVDAIGEGLFCGYLERFADTSEVPGTTRPAAWLPLCSAVAKLISFATTRGGPGAIANPKSERDPMTANAQPVSYGSISRLNASSTADSRSIAFVGNCQLQVLKNIYDRYVVPWTEDRTVYINAYIPSQRPDYNAIEAADIVVGQITDWAAPVSFEALPSRIVRHFVPVVSGGFLWPFAGQPRVGNPTAEFWPAGPYPAELGDAFLNKMIARKVDPESAVREYLALDINSLMNLDRLLEISIDKQRKRDSQTDYKTADFILDNFREFETFLTPFHPGLVLARSIAEQFLERIGAGRDAISRMKAGLTVTPFPREQLPIHPSVVAHFGLKYVEPDRRYRHLEEGSFTFPEFAERYMRCDWNPDLAEGLFFYYRNDNERALPKLLQGLQKSPNAPVGHFALGMILARSGDDSEAIDSLRAAVDLDPSDPHAHANLGGLLGRRGRLAEAESELRKAIELEPAGVGFRLRLVEVLERGSRTDEALDAANAAVALDPTNPHAYAQVGHLLADRGDLKGALGASRRAAKLDPLNPHAHAFLATLLERNGELDDAEEEFRAATELDPKVAGFRRGLSRLLARRDRPEEALIEARLALQLEPDDDGLQQWIQQLTSQPQQLSGTHPMEPDTMLDEVTVDFGIDGTAKQFLGEGWSGPEPTHTWSIGPRSTMVLRGLNPAKDYMLSLDVGACVFPPDVDGLQLRILAAGQVIGEFHLVAMNQICCQLDRNRIAEDGTAHLVFDHPKFVRPSDHGRADRRELAVCFRQLVVKQISPPHDDELELEGKLPVEGPEHAPGRGTVGPTAVTIAPEMVKESLPASQQSADTSQWALSLESEDEIAAAEAGLRQALETQPQVASLHGRLGEVLALQGRLDEAEQEVCQAIALDWKIATFHFVLSQILAQQGRTGNAVEAARRALELAPQNPSFQQHLETIVAHHDAALNSDAAPRATAAPQPIFVESSAADEGLRQEESATLTEAAMYPEAKETIRPYAPAAVTPYEALWNRLVQIAKQRLRLDDNHPR